jgi:hypothetical protein
VAVDAITRGLGTRLILAPNAAVRPGAELHRLDRLEPQHPRERLGVALSPNNATAYLTTADGNESCCG